jgi:hypothetical protein
MMARVAAGCRYDVDIVCGTGGLDTMLDCDYRRTRAVAMGLIECLYWELRPFGSWTVDGGGTGDRRRRGKG